MIRVKSLPQIATVSKSKQRTICKEIFPACKPFNQQIVEIILLSLPVQGSCRKS